MVDVSSTDGLSLSTVLVGLLFHTPLLFVAIIAGAGCEGFASPSPVGPLLAAAESLNGCLEILMLNRNKIVHLNVHVIRPVSGLSRLSKASLFREDFSTSRASLGEGFDCSGNQKEKGKTHRFKIKLINWFN